MQDESGEMAQFAGLPPIPLPVRSPMSSESDTDIAKALLISATTLTATRSKDWSGVNIISFPAALLTYLELLSIMVL